ncbi:MAG: 50S ribosome-binding GTPase, partial [Synergistaceae bacterium]|nr:50S ribosome-binding GTPase [Synergistaceae bacterium]
MTTEKTLKELNVNETAIIKAVGGQGSLRQHLLDMGIIPGAEVRMIKIAPMGDPIEIRIHDYELTLRVDDVDKITIDTSAPAQSKIHSLETLRESTKIEHPGLGEEGKYHVNDKNEPLPDGTILTYALAGNQNSGKTTLFNQLTGARQRIGNFPGVTVSRKDGVIKGHPETLVTDLPGIYSMSPYSGEEMISRHFILNEKPKAIINIIDATNIERNLYLTVQLLEMQVPMVVAVNMMDELSGNGGTIDINRMEDMLGVPVIPISALKNKGVDELIRHAIHIARYQERPKRYDFCDENDHGGAVHRCLHAISHLIKDHAERVGLPLRFAASKVAENDPLILKQLKLEQNEL